MDKFFNSNICYSRKVCHQCRDTTEKGKQFRLSVLKQYGGGKDECFECPFKVPWNCSRQRAQKSRGLGDTVEKITRRTGIKQTVEFVSKVTGRPCNCPKRQAALNKKYPYAD